jgi:hypothetical protein
MTYAASLGGCFPCWRADAWLPPDRLRPAWTLPRRHVVVNVRTPGGRPGTCGHPVLSGQGQISPVHAVWRTKARQVRTCVLG